MRTAPPAVTSGASPYIATPSPEVTSPLSEVRVIVPPLITLTSPSSTMLPLEWMVTSGDAGPARNSIAIG